MGKNKKKNSITKNQKIKKVNKLMPDSWDIENVDGTEILSFYRNDNKITEIPVTPEVFAELMLKLNEKIIIESNMADAWTYRKPVESGMPDFLTIIREGKILGTLTIDETDGKKLYKNLSKYGETKTIKESFNIWRKNHKILFALSTIIAAIVISSMIWGILSSFINL